MFSSARVRIREVRQPLLRMYGSQDAARRYLHRADRRFDLRGGILRLFGSRNAACRALRGERQRHDRHEVFPGLHRPEGRTIAHVRRFDQKTKTLSYLFDGCTALETIAVDAFSGLAASATTFMYAFQDCTSLQEVP